VRKQAKTYGTGRLAEGGDIDGLRLVVVEDVVTTGGQVRASAAELRARGAVVDLVVCVIDRQQGGAQQLVADDLKLASLFTAGELEA
jgi:orotate phosphoribosyltransferase